MKRRRLWVAIAKKEIPKAQKIKSLSRKDMLTQLKKLAKESQKDCRKQALQSQKNMKEAQVRARRLAKEMQVYWKR
jgi:DNA helicase INO80